MTYSEILEKRGYSFCGFWDSCFFTNNSTSSGLYVWNNNTRKYENITWRDFYKIAKEVCVEKTSQSN